MKKTILLFAFLFFSNSLLATTIIVDINGGGQFTTIQAAINAASSGDTVKVWPGTYSSEQVNLNKNITLMGSGYESTTITGNFTPTILVSAGRLQWFQISSTAGNGINLTGGTVKNCVIVGSSSHGIEVPSGTNSQVINCVLYQNSTYGIYLSGTGAIVSVNNCISRSNGSNGYRNYYGSSYLNLSYSNGSRSGTTGNQGCVDAEPGFASAPVDFHISEGSQCWNTGNPSLLDPDGSRSDMGYFGGPDCPIFPVVTEIIITPGTNTINLQAKARANY